MRMPRWPGLASRGPLRGDEPRVESGPAQGGRDADEALAELRAELEERSRLIQQVQMTADSRLERIHQLEANFQELREGRAAATARLDQQLLALRSALADRERELAELRAELAGLRIAPGETGQA